MNNVTEAMDFALGISDRHWLFARIRWVFYMCMVMPMRMFSWAEEVSNETFLEYAGKYYNSIIARPTQYEDS